MAATYSSGNTLVDCIGFLYNHRMLRQFFLEYDETQLYICSWQIIAFFVVIHHGIQAEVQIAGKFGVV